MAHIWPMYGIYYDQNHLEAASNVTDFPRLIMPLWRNVSTTSNSWPGNQISLDWDGNMVTFSWVLFHPFPCMNIFGSSQTLPKYTWQSYNIYIYIINIYNYRIYIYQLLFGHSVPTIFCSRLVTPLTNMPRLLQLQCKILSFYPCHSNGCWS